MALWGENSFGQPISLVSKCEEVVEVVYVCLKFVKVCLKNDMIQNCSWCMYALVVGS